MKRIIEAFKEKWPYYSLELLVITFGILLAFGLNATYQNWNEDRKVYKFESELLAELRNSIVYDYSSIENVLDGNLESKSSGQIILNHFDESLPYHDSLNYHFWKANHWWQLNLRHTAFEKTKTYGLNFIKDDSLRMLLSATYENDAKWWDDVDNRLALYQYSVVEPYILNLFESTNLGSDMNPHNYELLRLDQKYRTILKTNIGNREWFENIVEHRFLRRLKELDRRLLKEIKSR